MGREKEKTEMGGEGFITARANSQGPTFADSIGVRLVAEQILKHRQVPLQGHLPTAQELRTETLRTNPTEVLLRFFISRPPRSTEARTV